MPRKPPLPYADINPKLLEPQITIAISWLLLDSTTRAFTHPEEFGSIQRLELAKAWDHHRQYVTAYLKAALAKFKTLQIDLHFPQAP